MDLLLFFFWVALAQASVALNAGNPDHDPSPRSEQDRRRGHMTIEIVNKLGRAVQYAHTNNAGAPTPQGAASGVLGRGQRTSLTVPQGWAGNIAFVQNGGGRQIVGDESLIEGSHMDQGQGYPKFDINVSYVNGFSVPIVCYCEAGVIAGCNTNLWKGHCQDKNGKGSCRNPARHGGTHPPFFEPCRNAAYVYPANNEANTGNGACSNKVTCCIGSKCRRNPRQQGH